MNAGEVELMANEEGEIGDNAFTKSTEVQRLWMSLRRQFINDLVYNGIGISNMYFQWYPTRSVWANVLLLLVRQKQGAVRHNFSTLCFISGMLVDVIEYITMRAAAFLIPYLLMAVVVGLPLLYLELLVCESVTDSQTSSSR